MAIRQSGIAVQRRFVRLHRLDLALLVFEQHPQVIKQNGIVTAGNHRLAVDGFGFRETTGFVQQPPQVEICIEKGVITGDGLRVGFERAIGIVFLQRHASVEPVERAGRLSGERALLRGLGRVDDHPQVAGCGIALRRDLTALPPQSVIYDDMCGVQSYHDAIESAKQSAYATINADLSNLHDDEVYLKHRLTADTKKLASD